MKASIHELAIALVERGYKFHVDLEHRNLCINGKYIIREGKWNEKRRLHSFVVDKDSMFNYLRCLYSEYKYSRPTERSMSHRRYYFKALSEKDLTDNDMLYGTIRDVAQIKLELAVLCLILDGTFQWDEETMGKWFWQSPSDIDKEFVILRQWVEPNNNNN